MIEVFKTNVQEECKADLLVQMLLEHFPGGSISFDLEDCDRVLRIKHNSIITHQVSHILQQQGYHCEVLND